MKKIILSMLCVASVFMHAHSQTTNDTLVNPIHGYIEGYNAQDFEKMRNSMSGLLKLVFTEKRLEQIYSLQYEMIGSATIDSLIQKGNSQSYLANLKYIKDTTEIQTMGFYISKKNKIIGLSNPSYKFQFSKNDSLAPISEKSALFSIDSIVNLKHDAANFNGCILVLKNQKVFYEQCEGYADFETKSPLNDSTMFDLASCSKQFTAMAIMILQEHGKLSYDNTVNDFFPDFPYKNITIENLLTHTSGLPDYMDMLDKHWDKNKVATNKDILEYLIKYKPKASFKPGKEYEYSNTGYAILSLIIEQASGKSFSEFLSVNIFQPLGMKHSRVYNTRYSENEILINRANGHTFSSDSMQYMPVSKIPDLDYYIYMDGVTGDGAINSTITDLAIWDNSLRTYQLVSKETINKAIQSYKTQDGELSNYGYGWEIQNDLKYESLIYHSGNWGGNITFILHFLDKDLSVIILSNNEYFNTPKFAAKVAEIMNRL